MLSDIQYTILPIAITIIISGMVERLIPDTRHTVWDGDSGQPLATEECRIPDARHAVRNSNRGQPHAITERRLLNARAPVDHYGFQGVFWNVTNGISRKCRILNTCATLERRIPNARHAVRNGNRSQSRTTGERRISDACHRAIRRDDTVFTPERQSFATCFDQAIPLTMVFRIPCTYLNTRQTCATGERLAPNACHTIRDDNRGQPRATRERIIPDARHTVPNRH